MLSLVAMLATQAQAELTLVVDTSTDTQLDFTITGDFSGYTPPASLTSFLYLVPMDSNGNPVSDWVPFEQTGDRPDGEIDGVTINGWVFVIGADRNDDYSFLTGDGFNVSFGNGPYDENSVMTSPYTRNQTGLTLNTADVDHFNLYWGRTVLLATTQSAAPPAQAVAIPANAGPALALLVLLMSLVGLGVLRGRP